MAEREVPSEIEAKLLVPREADLRAIARLGHLGGHPLHPRGAGRLSSTYLDTSALTLATHGVALRVRRQAGHWEATAKWAGRVDADMHDRPELTVPLSSAPPFPFELPDGPLRTHLAALVARRPLNPILISEVHRRVFDVLPVDATPTNGVIAELALDRVRLRGPDAGQPATRYCEVEVERRQGDRRDISALSRLLQRDFNLVPSGASKFARGLLLLYGAGMASTREPPVLGHEPVEEAVRRIVGRHLRRLRLHDPGTRIGTDPEALHDMRVATRRLRAAVRLFEAGVPPRLQRSLKEELHWLGQLLGAVRDLDVQLAEFERFAATAPAGFRRALDSLRDYLQSERAHRRVRMLSGLDSARYFRLLVRLEDFALGRSHTRGRAAAGREPIALAGGRAIKKAFRRLIKRGQQIETSPAPEDLHALRIRAKRLRYLLEFLQELAGKPGGRLVKRLIALQDLLGSYHDAVVAADFVRVYVEGPGAQLEPAKLVALGALVASELNLAEKKRADFEATWRRFSRARTVKDCRAVLRRLRTLQPPPLSIAAPTSATTSPAI